VWSHCGYERVPLDHVGRLHDPTNNNTQPSPKGARPKGAWILVNQQGQTINPHLNPYDDRISERIENNKWHMK
jgi:hypothetical protein